MKFTDRHNIRQYHFLPKYEPVVLFRDIHKKAYLSDRLRTTTLPITMERHMLKPRFPLQQNGTAQYPVAERTMP
jgi:hypothetical protein